MPLCPCDSSGFVREKGANIYMLIYMVIYMLIYMLIFIYREKKELISLIHLIPYKVYEYSSPMIYI